MVSQVIVEPDSNLVPTERVEVPSYLGVVESLLFVIPEGSPLIPHTCLFRLQSLSEATERFATDLYAVQKIGVRPIGRVAKDRDEPGVGDRALDEARGSGTIQVRCGGLADGSLVCGTIEKGLVLCEVPYRDAPAARPAEFRVHALKEMWFLAGAHVDLRVLVEVMVERGRPRLLRAYYEEVGHRHAFKPPCSQPGLIVTTSRGPARLAPAASGCLPCSLRPAPRGAPDRWAAGR